MSITIKDLAQMANTSTATVSRVLSNKPGVAADKRRSILQLASKVGYTPNRIAQNLALKKSYLIGLIAADLKNFAYVDFFRRIQHALENQGYRVLIADSELDVEKEQHNIAMMREQRVEGLIVFPVHDWDGESDFEHFLELKLQKFPFVIVGRIEGYGLDYVTSEETETAYKLTRHLIDLGHSRFTFVGSDPNNRCVKERREGVNKALHEAGLSLKDEDCVVDRIGWVSDFTVLMRRPDRPTAVICINDVVALMVYQALHDLGLVIPRDVSVVGFDDNIWSQYMNPPLTTTAENNDEIARLCLQLLMEKVENSASPAAHRLIPQQIHLRDSSGRAPST